MGVRWMGVIEDARIKVQKTNHSAGKLSKFEGAFQRRLRVCSPRARWCLLDIVTNNLPQGLSTTDSVATLQAAIGKDTKSDVLLRFES